jgi:hypothetical protein
MHHALKLALVDPKYLEQKKLNESFQGVTEAA